MLLSDIFDLMTPWGGKPGSHTKMLLAVFVLLVVGVGVYLAVRYYFS